MPPTLRSAQSSPVGKTLSPIDTSPNVTPGRKVPRCTKCGRLRQGHPRSGCPYSESPARSTDAGPAGMKAKTLQENLSEALGSMYLDSSSIPDDRDGKPQYVDGNGRYRRSATAPPNQISESLSSISTTAEDMLNDLVKPGVLSQVTVLEDDTKGSPELDGTFADTPTKVRIKSGPRKAMPGTLIAPSWESSISAFTDPGAGEERERSPKKRVVLKSSLAVQTSLGSLGGETGPSPSSLSSPLASTVPRPLQRSLTMEQRDQFLSSLSQVSPASVYIHKKRELDSLQTSAKALKLHVRIIDNDDEGVEEEEDVLFVTGTDLRAVEKLADELRKSVNVAAANKGNFTTNNFFITNTTPDTGTTDVRSSSSTFKAMAGGAIAGVVGTWAGLALS